MNQEDQARDREFQRVLLKWDRQPTQVDIEVLWEKVIFWRALCALLVVMLSVALWMVSRRYDVPSAGKPSACREATRWAAAEGSAAVNEREGDHRVVVHKGALHIECKDAERSNPADNAGGAHGKESNVH